MKIIMPLFDFSTSIDGFFQFSYTGLSLSRLEENNATLLPGFSEIDIQHIKLEQWALFYQVDDNDHAVDYKEFVNLLLLAFRIFSDIHPPFIKFRICNEDTTKSSRISMVMSHIPKTEMHKDAFSQEQLLRVDEGFKHLQEIYRISTRTKNALHFLFKAYSFEKWAESFVMMMIVLEALFSKDDPPYNHTKKTICQRTSFLLSSRERCTKHDIEKLYDLRCDIVHGRIKLDSNTQNNLQNLAHLEYIISQCLRKLTEHNFYKAYSTKEDRDQFMNKLDSGGHLE